MRREGGVEGPERALPDLAKQAVVGPSLPNAPGAGRVAQRQKELLCTTSTGEACEALVEHRLPLGVEPVVRQLMDDRVYNLQ